MLTFARAIFLNVLLASSALSHSAAFASPVGGAGTSVSVPEAPGSSPLLLPTPEAKVADVHAKKGKGRHLKVKKEPTKNHKCPGTDRYGETTYTSGQVKKAYLQAAKLANSGKQLGANRYPHNFGNGERLPFTCGRNKKEFPLVRDHPGQVYNGEGVQNLPDRLVFEFRETKNEFQVGFCGVMRHGNGRDFVKCKEA